MKLTNSLYCSLAGFDWQEVTTIDPVSWSPPPLAKWSPIKLPKVSNAEFGVERSQRHKQEGSSPYHRHLKVPGKFSHHRFGICHAALVFSSHS